jgi:hypothetical protein
MSNNTTTIATTEQSTSNAPVVALIGVVVAAYGAIFGAVVAQAL